MTAGTGHRRAAEAIADAARRQLPQAEVVCVDLLAYVPRWVRWAYPRIYGWLVGSLPAFWAIAYYVVDHPWVFRLYQPLRRGWNRLIATRFLRWIDETQPDVVIATHFFPADVFGTARTAMRLRSRLIVVITDVFPHRLWLVPEADAVVVGSSQTKALCRQRGMRDDQLHVLGIPIGGSFGTSADRQRMAIRLGLDPRRRTILLVSGGMGMGSMHRLVRRFATLETTHPGQLQLLVVCGQNRRLRQRLDEWGSASAMPVRVFGFVDTMHELMAASDLLVTKAGGLTIMEALAMGLPMVFYGVIPGQERFNAEHVVQHHAGIMVRSVDEAVGAVLRVLDDSQQLEAMRSSALALGKPQAASELVDRLLIASSHGTP